MQMEQTGLTGAAAAWFFHEVAKVASGANPSDQVAMVERSARAGAMGPLHARSVDESYRVLTGEVTFFVGDETVTAVAGDVVVAPRDVPRTFRVESDGARWLVITRVRSLERFQDFGRAAGAPALQPETGWPSPDEEAAVAAIAGANGVELLGPPGALPSPGSRERSAGPSARGPA
jgi:quercetin dioxygenase-like cupin family protein